jgi:serine phosphatase RsbU (regulator of sigma subunit)
MVGDRLLYAIFAFGITVFLNNISLSRLLYGLLGKSPPYKKYFGIMSLCFLLFFCAIFATESFLLQSIFICLGASYPLIESILSAKKHWRFLSSITKAYVGMLIMYYIHTIDFAFLRDKADLAAIGYIVAYFLIYTLAIIGPAVITELISRQKAKTDAEINEGKNIQTQLLPKTIQIHGYECVSYLKQANTVGGDFYDVISKEDGTWVILGDITGHSISSGLVMFMVQSTLSTLIHSIPKLSPKKLNFLANTILFKNISRLESAMNSTINALKINDNICTYSGFGCDMFVFRAETQTAHIITIDTIPYKLGSIESPSMSQFLEEHIELSEGDIIVLVTDGVSEAPKGGDHSAGMFELERIRDIIASNFQYNSEYIKNALVNEILTYTNGNIYDDMTIMVIKRITKEKK